MEWEYRARTIQRGMIIEDVLNACGAKGWELVAAHTHHNLVTVYLKRPKEVDNYGK